MTAFSHEGSETIAAYQVSTNVPALQLEHHALPARAATLSVIGGGFCGTLGVIQIARTYRELHDLGTSLPPLEISWWDRDAQFGRGIAYARECGDALLNQPARCMSPFPNEPELYTEWLASHGYGRNDFTPRALYGTFLLDLLQNELEAVAASGTPLTVKLIPQESLDIRRNVDGGLSVAGIHEHMESDGVLLATGHYRRDRLQHLDAAPWYVENPLSQEKLIELLDRHPNPKEVLLVGAGPTAIDTLRTIERSGYRGNYTVVSSVIGALWRFDPDFYTAESFIRYSPRVLAPENIARCETYRDLRRLLNREIESAKQAGFGEGHVYYGTDIEKLFPADKPLGEHQQLFVRHLTLLKSAIVTPDNFELLRALKISGRLRWIRGRADEQSLQFDDAANEFTLNVVHQNGRAFNVHAALAINCGAISREVGENPVTDSAQAHALLRLSDTGLLSSNGAENLAVVGPHALPEHGRLRTAWGVESFREQVLHEATRLVHAVLQKGKVPP